MPINWQDKAVADRLLASIIASIDGKLNCTEIARIFGPDATYNAIEGFLRGPKAMAKKLKEEAADRPTASPARPRAGARTPKSSPAKASLTKGVQSGRVTKTKAAPATPSKLKNVVKQEGEADDTFFDNMGGPVGASDGNGDGDDEQETEV